MYSRAQYRGQDYCALKAQAQHLGVPFQDPYFPPDASSLAPYHDRENQVVWKRIVDIPADEGGDEPARLWVDRYWGHFVIPGTQSPDWFLAAAASLTIHPALWEKVVPDSGDQELCDCHPQLYAGIHVFYLYRFGVWMEIVVDDYLPVLSDNGEMPYSRSDIRNEFWASLLEKAFAKLFGSYDAFRNSCIEEALTILSGGISETIDVTGQGYNVDLGKQISLWEQVRDELKDEAVMVSCADMQDNMMSTAFLTAVKLTPGRYYHIVRCATIFATAQDGFGGEYSGQVYLLKLVDPTGQSSWSGPFSPTSEYWAQVDDEDKARIGFWSDDSPDSFWMSVADFCHYFNVLVICRDPNTSFFTTRKTWHESSAHGIWSRVTGTAGGSSAFTGTFLSNPQYRFDVRCNAGAMVMISLTQKFATTSMLDPNEPPPPSSRSPLSIGFSVLQTEANRECRVHRLEQNEVATSDYQTAFSIFMRKFLPPGRYVIIPTAYSPDLDGSFFLRLFTPMRNFFKPLTQDIPTFVPFLRYPKAVSVVHILKAKNLERSGTFSRFKAIDAYCIVRCERIKVRTPIIPDSCNPEFDFKCLFYRRDPGWRYIKIQIWHKNKVWLDEYLGKHIFRPREETGDLQTVGLVSRKREKNRARTGLLVVSITTTPNMASI